MTYTEFDIDSLIQDHIRDKEGGAAKGKPRIELDDFDRVFTAIKVSLFEMATGGVDLSGYVSHTENGNFTDFQTTINDGLYTIT